MLGVILDLPPSFAPTPAPLTICAFHLQNLSRVWQLLLPMIPHLSGSSISRLDYCRCFPTGSPASSLAPNKSVPHPQSEALSPHVVPMARHDLVPGCIRGPTLHTLSSVHWVAGSWVFLALCEVPDPRAFALADLTTWKVFPVISTWLPAPHFIPVSLLKCQLPGEDSISA